MVNDEVFNGLDGEGPGPVVGKETEDLNLTLLSWPSGHQIAEHVNQEVDVVSVVLSGSGVVRIGEVENEVRAGSIFIIPKGASRSLTSTSDDFRYVNIHKRRRRLMPTMSRDKA